MSKKSKKRKEFEKMKRQPGFYNFFGGRAAGKNIHHKKSIGKGGGNELSNLVLINKGLHDLLHRLARKKEIENTWIAGKNPSSKKVVDFLGQRCLEKHLQDTQVR